MPPTACWYDIFLDLLVRERVVWLCKRLGPKGVTSCLYLSPILLCDKNRHLLGITVHFPETHMRALALASALASPAHSEEPANTIF